MWGYLYRPNKAEDKKTNVPAKYNAKIKNIDHSAITEHAVTLGHQPKWDDVEILEFILERIRIVSINRRNQFIYPQLIITSFK